MTELTGVGSVGLDSFDVRRATRAPGLLAVFNQAGVLVAADVHVALVVARLAGESDESVLLAAALAARAPRLGHTCTDLARARHTVAVDAEHAVEVSSLPWPDPQDWIASLGASALVGTGPAAPPACPLRLDGTRVYLDRYWREERRVAADLAARAAEPFAGVDVGVLAEGLARLFGPLPATGPEGTPLDEQRLAAATAVLRPLSVVAGGPGTGKTTTVARILALLFEQAAAAGLPPPLVALAAPTGKAASRLEESVHAEAAGLAVADDVRARLAATGSSTLHRLLGWRPGSRSRFRHDRANRLPHDVVVVDETSMVSLSLMAKLVEAVRPDARLVLVGDPQQLASVEAGAVLGDIVGPAAGGLLMRPEAHSALAGAVGGPVGAGVCPAGVAVGDGVVVLRTVHRYGGGIASAAESIQRGDTDAVLATLAAGGAGGDVVWIVPDPPSRDVTAPEAPPAALRALRTALVEAGGRVKEAARAGDGRRALDALGAFRLLCAHRRGPFGVDFWSARAERWLAGEFGGEAGPWYVGRPLLITENDYGLRLFNGDVGVVVADPSGRSAATFERRGELLSFAPTRLSAVETVHAMTVHKAQGSQFDTVAVVLPPAESPILTRELLYTAVTRARSRLILVGTEESVRAAVANPVARASGLRDLLWERTQGPGEPGP